MVTNKTRHIQRKYNFIHWELELRNKLIEKIYIDDNLANPFIKSFFQKKFEGYAKGIRL